MDYELHFEKADLLKTLREAKECSKRVDTTYSTFIMEGEKLKLEIQDDFFMANMDNGGWISLFPEEFTPDMVVFLFEMNAGLATEEVLQALLKAAGI